MESNGRSQQVEQRALRQAQRARFRQYLHQSFARSMRDMRLAEDLDAYAHAVAHDLKSPVSIINGYSDLLELAIQQGDLTGAGELVSRIVNGCDTMTENIEELLLLASVRRLDEVVMDRLDMTGIVCQVLER
jgi:signal transduction histidine kinase